MTESGSRKASLTTRTSADTIVMVKAGGVPAEQEGGGGRSRRLSVRMDQEVTTCDPACDKHPPGRSPKREHQPTAGRLGPAARPTRSRCSHRPVFGAAG